MLTRRVSETKCDHERKEENLPAQRAVENRGARAMIASGELSVVLVTYNSAHVVGAALSSLPPGCQLICVDNASKDELGSVLAGFDVALIRNSVNRGYGAACNQGAREATGQFVLFMNPDVTFEPGAIRALLDAARRYPDCRTFVPRTHTSDGKLWFDDRSGTDRMLGRHREVATTKLGGDCCVRFADGGAFMIDRELFLDIGGFDEGFLLYYEDDDLSHRLVQRGEPIIVVDDAVAIHAVGTSVALGRRGVISRNRAKKNSEIHFKTKYGVPYHGLADGLLLLGKLIFYAAILSQHRLFAAWGKFTAVVDHLRKAPPAGL